VSVEAWSPLAGKTAVVTGGATGIGAEIARLFAAAGAGGAILDRAPADPPAGWRWVEADVTDDESLAGAFRDFERIDVLVAAAGIVPPWSSTESLDLAEWDDVFAVNARGVAATLLHAAPHLGDGGSIVVIASLNSWRGDPRLIAYTASKHAVLGVVRSVAPDLGSRGIRVNAVAPGPVATAAMLERMRRRAAAGGTPVEDALAASAGQTALGRIATEGEVAGAALFLASDLSRGITGHLLPVDGGIA
jgi:NAD(P)-dependent dehydrogenase (short-subunit alcohol dehydrogenase family)